MKIKSYKGMDKNMQCRGFQYEVGKEYEEETAKVCVTGFHACEDPLNVLRYYSPADSRYFEVEQSGKLDRELESSKIASSKIKIGAEIGLHGIIKAHFEYIKERIEKDDQDKSSDDESTVATSGDRSTAVTSGYQSTAVTSGYESMAIVSGKDSIAVSTGYNSKSKASIGSAIVVAERGEWNGETYPLIAIKAAIIDGVSLKPDTFYTLKNGEFVEVE